ADATASKKYGDNVGSPPENCTLIWRRGLMVIALSSICLISSHVSSCTKPTWFASIKQGSHIMLQRLVRSMVSTDPRPYFTVEEPWLCSFSSLCARMSRPGNTSSRCCENSVSIDITSSKWPCFGQSLIIMILPSRSTMVALISPTFSLSRISVGKWPSRICWRISGTHFGQSESVVRGQPSGGFDFWYDLSSGLSDHLGVGEGLGLMRLKRSRTNHAPDAAIVTAFSTYLTGLCMNHEPFRCESRRRRASHVVRRTQWGLSLGSARDVRRTTCDAILHPYPIEPPWVAQP